MNKLELVLELKEFIRDYFGHMEESLISAVEKGAEDKEWSHLHANPLLAFPLIFAQVLQCRTAFLEQTRESKILDSKMKKDLEDMVSFDRETRRGKK
jgi:hypothetical protein